MNIEDTIGAVIAAQLAPLKGELRRVTAELESLRRAMPPQLITMREAARRLGISLATVRRRVRDNTLPFRRVGRSVRVDLTGLHAPLESEVTAHVVALRNTSRHTG